MPYQQGTTIDRILATNTGTLYQTLESQYGWPNSVGFSLDGPHLQINLGAFIVKSFGIKNRQIQSPGPDPSRLQTISSNDWRLSLRDVCEMVDYSVLGLGMDRGLTADIWMVRKAKCIGMSHSSLDRFPALLDLFYSQIQCSKMMHRP